MVLLLASNIGFQRPDLFSNFSYPTSFNPHQNFFPDYDIPDIGELMVASFPADIKFIRSVSANTWWIGEKYDGVRCCWNPKRLNVYTRSARPIALHPKFIPLLPKIFIDGELWFGRGLFSLSYNLYKDSSDCVQWDLIRMVAFDVPSRAVKSIPFELRYSELIDNIKATHPFLKSAAMRAKCKNSVHLKKFVGGIIEDEGEGVICRLVGSGYVNGRSHQLVKLKTSYGDMEALVVSLGKDFSVLLKLPNGEIFVVAPSEVKIQVEEIEIGDVVTFSYEIHARREGEIPVNAVIERVRKDIEWQDVVLNSIKERKFRNESDKIAEEPLVDSWNNARLLSYHGKALANKYKGDNDSVSNHAAASWKEIRQRRQFFESYAKENGFDPLIPDNWYSKSREWMKSQKVHSILAYYDSSVVKALIDLFPEIGLDKSKLTYWPLHYAINRRQFFEDFAKNNKFDPLVSDNWYLVSEDSILNQKQGNLVIGYHQNNLPQALMDLFPEIGLNKTKFWIQHNSSSSTKGSWSTSLSRRNFFENYARINGFDPLLARNWYSQSSNKIKEVKGAQRVLSYHGNSVSKALMDLFPNIGLERTKFNFPQKFWNKPSNRRKFFEDYARVNQFNPLDIEQWYMSARFIENEKGAPQILSYHRNSASQALSDLFPTIRFDLSKFLTLPPWAKVENRRKAFEEFAKKQNFDPLVAGNWYSRSSEITSAKELKHILYFYKHNVVSALLDLFPNIGLDQSKFMHPQKFWHRMANRRKFFEDYAIESKFDPLVPENWYIQSIHDILAKKGALRVLFYHRDNLAQALVELFPDVPFDKSKLLFPKVNKVGKLQ